MDFNIKTLAEEWNEQFKELLQKKKVNPLTPYQPSRAYIKPTKPRRKIAVVLGAYSIGTRPLNLNKILTDDRGLTGTDFCFLRVAEELQALGNEVVLFSVFSEHPAVYNGMKAHQVSEISLIDASYDCAVVLNEPQLFAEMDPKPLKVCYMMLNDFTYLQPNFPGFDDHVDVYAGVCEEHTEHMKKQSHTPEKWITIPLGCDPDNYEDRRIPGKVVWCSSADRGLHWLLSVWPEIKRQVPSAFLKVFYHFNYIHVEEIEDGTDNHPHVIEMANRVRYIRHAMNELKSLDVEHVGSVSRERMKKEFSEASVFAFPADTLAFSEGFSLSTLEAHASYTTPVMTSADCLGGIYSKSGAVMVQAPVGERLEEFTAEVVRALQDKKHADDVIKDCRNFAAQHTWKKTASKLLETINESISR